MPIYEYQCTSCQHQFDQIQKISDAAIKTCPNCHQDTAIRLISAAGFQLKGTGWYVTDFKNKDNRIVKKENTEPTKEGAPSTSGTGAASTEASSSDKKPSESVAKPTKEKQSTGEKN